MAYPKESMAYVMEDMMYPMAYAMGYIVLWRKSRYPWDRPWAHGAHRSSHRVHGLTHGIGHESHGIGHEAHGIGHGAHGASHETPHGLTYPMGYAMGSMAYPMD